MQHVTKQKVPRRCFRWCMLQVATTLERCSLVFLYLHPLIFFSLFVPPVFFTISFFQSYFFLLVSSPPLFFIWCISIRAEKEKGQLKSEVEDLQAQIQNIVKNKVQQRIWLALLSTGSVWLRFRKQYFEFNKWQKCSSLQVWQRELWLFVLTYFRSALGFWIWCEDCKLLSISFCNKELFRLECTVNKSMRWKIAALFSIWMK